MRLAPYAAVLLLLVACAETNETGPDASTTADDDASTGVDAAATAACPDGEVATAITASGELTCTSVAAVAAAAMRSRCSVYLGHRDSCTGCSDPPAKWSTSGSQSCSAGVGAGNMCVDATLDDPSSAVRLATIDLDGDVNNDDKLYATLHCATGPRTSAPAPCPEGSAITGWSGDHWTCTSLAEMAVGYARSQCSIYLGWQDSCDGCVRPPTKWGYANDTSCRNGAGDNNTCTPATLGGETVMLCGLNTRGDVDGNDKLHVAFDCAAPTTSPPTRSQTLCPPGQFVRAIQADGFFECVDPDAIIATYVQTRCSLFFGWRDSCNACTAAPTKWGKVGHRSCATGGGVDDTCTAMALDGTNLEMFGLSPDGNVNGDDTLYAALRCDL